MYTTTTPVLCVMIINDRTWVATRHSGASNNNGATHERSRCRHVPLHRQETATDNNNNKKKRARTRMDYLLQFCTRSRYSPLLAHCAVCVSLKGYIPHADDASQNIHHLNLISICNLKYSSVDILATEKR